MTGTPSGTPDGILDFWFQGVEDSAPIPGDRNPIWFGAKAETDAVIRERFLADYERARDGALDGWQQTPRGALALVLLLDQVSRTVNRGKGSAFEADRKALGVTRATIARGDDRKLGAIERWFLYMPFMHAEDRPAQAEGVERFEALAREAPPAHREMLESALDYAKRHAAIVERFGRFPHRNVALGRTSTGEEVEFLKTPGSSF